MKRIVAAVAVLLAGLWVGIHPPQGRVAPSAAVVTTTENPCDYAGAVCGTIRWSGTPTAHWETIEDAGHESTGVDHVDTTTTYVRVFYTFTATKVQTCQVTPDETLARDVNVGASVGLAYFDLYFWIGTGTTPANPLLVSRAGGNIWITCFHRI